MTTMHAQKHTEESLYDSVLSAIASGQIAGGQRLKVSDLARRFEVSTSPVREVLRRLQGEGFVDISPNRGATVRKADANTIQNIFEILQLLEPYFVSWFVDYARPEDLEEMDDIQARMKALVPFDVTRFRLLDYRFHDCICRNHYNPVATEEWRKLRKALNVHGARLRVSQSRFNTIIDEHDVLLAAFRDTDGRAADRVIKSHVNGSIVQMTQQMRSLGI